MSRRTEKVGDQLQTEIADLLMRNVKHPALTDVMLSITKVELTPDFRRARISVSLLAEDGKAGFDEVLEALERTQGPDHMDTLTSVSNLASVLHAQCNLVEAEPLFLRALDGRLDATRDQILDATRKAQFSA